MTSEGCDVVVVGAGLSGLTAASALLEKDRDLDVIVLEAKERIGGRTLTKQLQAADGFFDFWDIGGEWVGRPYPHLQYLLEKFQLDTFIPDRKLSEDQRQQQPLRFLPSLDLYVLSLRLQRQKTYFDNLGDAIHVSVDALQSDGITFEEYCDKHIWTSDAKIAVEAACKSMFGLRPVEMSLLYFLKHVSSAGGFHNFRHPELCSGQERRIKGGAQQLCHRLSQCIGIRAVLKNQPVTHIIQMESCVVVRTETKTFQCQRVIIAVPPHLIANIKFTPEIPSNKMDILRNVPLAHLVKFVYTYEEKFWSAGTSSDQSLQVVLEDHTEGPVGIAYDGTSSRGNPAIVGFVSSIKGPANVQDPRRQSEAILSLLEDAIGSQVVDYIDSACLDWSTEKYNGGCFLKSIVPSTTRYLCQTIREPFDRVHFAGTETGTVWCGLMNGAVQSGLRAAAEVLYCIRPNLVNCAEYPNESTLFPVHNNSSSGGSRQRLLLGLLGMGLTSLIGIWCTIMIKPKFFKPGELLRLFNINRIRYM